MSRLARFLIGLVAHATPAIDRESVVGDTIERFDELRTTDGDAAARRWLRREVRRVVFNAPRHWLAARHTRHQILQQGRNSLMSSLGQDVRYALRWFGRSPGFTAVAVLTLALGIGANTAMFAVVNAVLLKPLPFANADRLMLVHLLSPRRDGGYSEMVWSYPKFKTLTELQQVFDDLALFSTRMYSLSGDGDPEVLSGEVITDSYTSVLGVNPMLGRTFTADEAQRAGASPVAMISQGLWARRYGSDPGVVGRGAQIDGVTHTIVGVLPNGFAGLNGNGDIWTPLGVTDAWALTEAQGHSYSAVARRRADVSEAVAIAAVRVYGGDVDNRHREGAVEGRAMGAVARSLDDSRVDADLRRVALVVLGAVGFVLLIACVNLTNLLVAKAIARRREVAIRIALGAGRGRVVRQFVVESLLLSSAGAVAGLVVATGLLAAAITLLPDSNVFFRTPISPGTPRISGAAGLTRVGAGMIGLDALTLAFTVGVTLVTALLVSVLPAFQASGLRPLVALRAGGTSSARGFRRFGSRTLLVGTEIAMALVLLAGAGLMLKSASRLQHTRIGVDPANVLSAQVSLPAARYTADTGSIFQQTLVERLRAIPGVEAAGWGFCMPVSGGCNGTSIWFPPVPQDAQPRRSVGIAWATPGYFDALRVPILQGRHFADGDRVGRPKVAIVNETAARTYWSDESPIGKRIAVGQGGFADGAEVIGVVGDVRYRTLETEAGPHVFLPLAQSYRGGMQVVVRSQLGARAMAAAITREVRALDPNLPLVSVKTMDERVGDAMWRTRVAAWLLAAFAGLALLLTAIGIFGVMAQTVAQRTAEIGIRMALGAGSGDVLRLVLGRAALVTGLGLAVGVVAALGLTHVLTTLLYEVTPTDPATLVIVAFVLGAVSLLACYIPARRAMKVNAVTALRTE